ETGIGRPEVRERLLPPDGRPAFDLGGVEAVEGGLVGDGVADAGRTARPDLLDRAEGDLLPGREVAGEVAGRPGAATDRPPGFGGICAQFREEGVERFGTLGEDGRRLRRRLLHRSVSFSASPFTAASPRR